MDKTPLLSTVNSSSPFYPGISSPFYPGISSNAADGVREVVDPERYTPPAQCTQRASKEVEVISGAKVDIRVVVDGMLLGKKRVKVQVFPESTVLSLLSTIRVQWAIDRNAMTLAGGKVRYVDELVKEDGALLMPRYPAALLFSDKSSNTTAIEITYMYERVEKPCCQLWSISPTLLFAGFVAVIVRCRVMVPSQPRHPPPPPPPHAHLHLQPSLSLYLLQVISMLIFLLRGAR